jgi:NPCBM-associated, NEW3 domain of alpha-galactosidase
LTNHAKVSVSGTVSASAPAGWTVSPSSVAFGPTAPGASAAVAFSVTVAAGAAPGSYPVPFMVTSNVGSVRTAARVTLIGNVVEFTPGTDAETPWLFEDAGSQLDGTVYDGRARFCDGSSSATYRFLLPSDVTGGTLALDIGNQYLVEVSTDNATWRTILVEANSIRDLSNRATRTFDLNDLRGTSRVLYVRIADSQPQDGWGAWLARARLNLTRTG